MQSNEHMATEEVIDIANRQGVLFELSVDFTLTAGAFLKSVFKTGSKPVVFISRKVSFNGDGVNAFVYKNPTYTGGAKVDTYNPNDINKKIETAEFLSGATVTDDGLQSRANKYVFGSDANQGKGGILQLIDLNEPQLILPNSELLFVIENRDAANQKIASHVKWIEPDNIPGLIIQDGEFVDYDGVTL